MLNREGGLNKPYFDCYTFIVTVILWLFFSISFPSKLRVLYVNSYLDWYGKNVPVIQSALYCFGCKERGFGGGGGGCFSVPVNF